MPRCVRRIAVVCSAARSAYLANCETHRRMSPNGNVMRCLATYSRTAFPWPRATTSAHACVLYASSVAIVRTRWSSAEHGAPQFRAADLENRLRRCTCDLELRLPRGTKTARSADRSNIKCGTLWVNVHFSPPLRGELVPARALSCPRARARSNEGGKLSTPARVLTRAPGSTTWCTWALVPPGRGGQLPVPLYTPSIASRHVQAVQAGITRACATWAELHDTQLVRVHNARPHGHSVCFIHHCQLCPLRLCWGCLPRLRRCT